MLSTHEVSAEPIPGSEFGYGNWKGVAWTNDTTGRFSHCSISASYVSGSELYFSVNSDASVSVAVQGDLRLREGQKFPVALYVDRRAPFYGTATALSPDFAVLTITDFDAAMTAFRKGYLLRIEALGGFTDYSLKGTFRALEAAGQCALKNFDYVSRPAVQDKTELFQLATTIISELQVKDFRYLTEGELLERNWENAVAWQAESEGIVGLSLITPWEGAEDLRSTDPFDTQFIATECGGDYATSARAMDLGEQAGEARELRLVCENDGQSTEIYLTKFLSGDRVVYTVLAFDVKKWSEPGRIEQRSASENALIRAASFMQDQ